MECRSPRNQLCGTNTFPQIIHPLHMVLHISLHYGKLPILDIMFEIFIHIIGKINHSDFTCKATKMAADIRIKHRFFWILQWTNTVVPSWESTKPHLCSKFPHFKTSWWILRVLPHLCPLESYLPYLRAFQWGTLWPCN